MSVEKDIKILIGYINKFEYTNEVEGAMLNDHPMVGRVYRLIQDSNGYRLHIGRENNPAGIDGWMLGKRLKNSLKNYKFDISVVDDESFLKLELHQEDVDKMVKWLKNDHKDLYAYLGITTPVVATSVEALEELRALLSQADTAEEIFEKATSNPEPLDYTVTVGLPDDKTLEWHGVLTHHISSEFITIVQLDGGETTIPVRNVLFITTSR